MPFVKSAFYFPTDFVLDAEIKMYAKSINRSHNRSEIAPDKNN